MNHKSIHPMVVRVLYLILSVFLMVMLAIYIKDERVSGGGSSGGKGYEALTDGRMLFRFGAEGERVLTSSPEGSARIKPAGPDEEIFYITAQKNGFYSIVSTLTWRYLAVGEDGGLVFEENFEGNENQLFAFRHPEGIRYELCTMDGRAVGYGQDGLLRKECGDSTLMIELRRAAAE